jgi:hypothetical protein
VEADCSLGLKRVLQTKIQQKWRSVTRTSPLDLALIMGALPRAPVEGVEVGELQCDAMSLLEEFP